MRDSIKEYVSIGGHDVVANVVEEAWNHQSYYNDLSMVKWTKKADGTWEFDYDWYDAWINFMIECKVLDPANGIDRSSVTVSFHGTIRSLTMMKRRVK